MGENQINHKLAQLIESTASRYLEQGRVGWDLPHTKAVVRYAMEIGKSENLDPLIVFTSAWFHDTGYAGLFDNADSSNMQNILNRKKLHMIKGAEYVATFLNKPEVLRFYSADQRQRIIHLVGIHDKLKELQGLDEIVLMEADTLGGLNPEGNVRNLDANSQKRYLQGVLKARWPKFRTELGMKYFRELS